MPSVWETTQRFSWDDVSTSSKNINEVKRWVCCNQSLCPKRRKMIRSQSKVVPLQHFVCTKRLKHSPWFPPFTSVFFPWLGNRVGKWAQIAQSFNALSSGFDKVGPVALHLSQGTVKLNVAPRGEEREGLLIVIKLSRNNQWSFVSIQKHTK